MWWSLAKAQGHEKAAKGLDVAVSDKIDLSWAVVLRSLR
jgi:hypothetical protein